MEPTKYERKATEIAVNLGIEVIAAYQGNQCPDRLVKDPFRTYSTCKDCGSIHGDKYRVTIKRTATGRSVSFDYWASWASCNALAGDIQRMNVLKRKEKGAPSYGWQDSHPGNVIKLKYKPGYYDILCCVASDASGSTDPDEIFEEYGPMPPSKAEQIAQHARKLQAFFTPAEIEALSHVDE